VVDPDGYVWGTNGQSLRRYDADLADYESFTVSGTQYQLAADRDGHIWGAEQWGSDVVVVEASSGDEVANEIEGCRGSCLSWSYLEGDPTGVRFRRAFGGGLGEATATSAFDSGCPNPVWNHIRWEASGGGVEISARTDGGEWVVVGSAPPDGSAAAPPVGDGSVLEVRATLLEVGARVARISVDWDCWQAY
jgi:hypothetical protein